LSAKAKADDSVFQSRLWLTRDAAAYWILACAGMTGLFVSRLASYLTVIGLAKAETRWRGMTAAYSAGAWSVELLRPAINPSANPPTARIGISFLMPIARTIWMPAATIMGSASAV
jgi:hypothetical protein